MTDINPDIFDRALAKFRAKSSWSAEATDDEKTLVAGNLNGFVAYLREIGLEDFISECEGEIDDCLATSLGERLKAVLAKLV